MRMSNVRFNLSLRFCYDGTYLKTEQVGVAVNCSLVFDRCSVRISTGFTEHPD
jgi:hypothetical protein